MKFARRSVVWFGTAFGAVVVLASMLLPFRASGQMVWTPLGPPVPALGPRSGFANGRVAAIAVDPDNQARWLVGFGNGGVWETRDSGNSFRSLSDDWPTLRIGAMAFAPSDPRTIYVGTGESLGEMLAHVGVGILKSTDGGQSWSLLAQSQFARAAVKRIRVHPTDPNVLLAATSRAGFGRDTGFGAPAPPPFGILKSSDGGATWVRTLAGNATGLEVDRADFTHAYAAIGERAIPAIADLDAPNSRPNGVYRSVDAGQTWNVVVGPWGPSSTPTVVGKRIELALSPTNPNVLYVSIQNEGSNTLRGLYRTDDAWAATPTWIQVPMGPTAPDGFCQDRCNYVHVISVDPSDANTLVAGGGYGSLWRCTNCGTSPVWTKISTPNGDYHVVAWAPNRLIVGEDHGVYSSTDLGGSWKQHSLPIAESSVTFYNGVLHPTNPDFVLASVRDIGGILVRQNDGLWRQIRGSNNLGHDVGEADVAISKSRPDTDWIAGLPNFIIGRTTDAGLSWSDADDGIDKTGAAWVVPISICPSDSDVVLTGSTRLWRSNNFFTGAVPSWTVNSPPSSLPLPPKVANFPSVLSIEFTPSDNRCETYAFGNRGGQIFLTRDGGRTWTNLDPSGTLPARPVNGLAFHPTDPNVVYAALSSFDVGTPGKPGHVFRTTNALGSSPSWENVSPPIDQPFNAIRIDPTDPRLIYAGSDTGLWRSTDGAVTWTHEGPASGLPHVAVYDIEINAQTKRTVVFTYGRGAFGLGFN